MTTSISTDDSAFSAVSPFLAAVGARDSSTYGADTLNGWDVYATGRWSGTNTPFVWIRDVYWAVTGWKYFSGATEKRLKDSVDMFLQWQGYRWTGSGWTAGAKQGQLQDFSIDAAPDYQKAGRADIEADLEYIHILLTHLAWQATGDDAWMGDKLSALSAAWDYAFSDQMRYDSETGLVKRLHTTDTWDFDFKSAMFWDSYEQAASRNGQGICAAPYYWTILTTDIAGFYKAALAMAEMHGALGHATDAATWNARATSIKSAAETHLWDSANSRWKLHKDLTLTEGQVISPNGVSVTHTDASRYGVMGNAVASLWGLGHESDALDTYKTWADTVTTTGDANGSVMFEPWAIFSPPYPTNMYVGRAPYVYSNGGLAAWIGALWSRLCFDNDDAPRGWDLLSGIISKFNALGGAFGDFYYPNGNPSNPGGNELVWNYGPVIEAVVNGLAGIKEAANALATVDITPHWAEASPSTYKGKTYSARMELPASSTYVTYTLTYDSSGETASGTIDGTHASGMLNVPGMTPVVLTGGYQEFATGIPSMTLTATPADDHIALEWTDTVSGEDGWYVERRVVS